MFQSSGQLAPNNGAAPGTAAYVTNNYLETSGTQVYPVNKESVKGDHIFNDKHRISGYYGHDQRTPDLRSRRAAHSARPVQRLTTT